MSNIRLVGATGRGVISGNHGSMVQLVKTRDRFNSRCRSMATRGGLFIMLALLSIPLVAWSTQKLVAQQAPDFALKSIAGENMRLSEYRGEVVMITFWSTWCGRCRDQLPVVDDLYMSHRDQGFKVLSVSIDDDIRRTLRQGIQPVRRRRAINVHRNLACDGLRNKHIRSSLPILHVRTGLDHVAMINH